MPNENIKGIPTKACINGITKDQATNIKTIPLLDQRITALEEGGSSGGSEKTWVYKEMTLENLNKYLPIDEATGNRKTNTCIVIGACNSNEEIFTYVFRGNGDFVPRGNKDYYDYILSKDYTVTDKPENNNLYVDVIGFKISLGKSISAIETNDNNAVIGADFTYEIFYYNSQNRTELHNVTDVDILYDSVEFYRVFMYVLE